MLHNNTYFVGQLHGKTMAVARYKPHLNTPCYFLQVFQNWIYIYCELFYLQVPLSQLFLWNMEEIFQIQTNKYWLHIKHFIVACLCFLVLFHVCHSYFYKWNKISYLLPSFISLYQYYHHQHQIPTPNSLTSDSRNSQMLWTLGICSKCYRFLLFL